MNLTGLPTPKKPIPVKEQLKNPKKDMFILKPEHLRESFRKLIVNKKLDIYLLDMMSIHVYYRDMAMDLLDKKDCWIAFTDGEKTRLL